MAHLVRVSSLSGRACARIRPVLRGSRWREQPPAPVSCGLSARRHLLVGPSFPAASRSWAFLAVGLPGTPGPRRGFHVPHSRDPTGVGALCTPGPRCSHGRHVLPGRRRRFPAAGPAPSTASHPGGLHDEASTRVSLALTRPVFPLPVAPVWDGRPWAFPLMLQTPPLPATPVRVGTDHEHFSGSHRRLHPVPPIGEITRTMRLRVASTCCNGPPCAPGRGHWSGSL